MDQFLIRAAGYYKDVSNESRLVSYYSNDGTTWTLIGSPQNIPMISSSPLIGLCVTAHNDAAGPVDVIVDVSGWFE